VLRKRFAELWRERNHNSEIGITLVLYDNAIAGLTGSSLGLPREGGRHWPLFIASQE
jgi:hypothetical protein